MARQETNITISAESNQWTAEAEEYSNVSNQWIATVDSFPYYFQYINTLLNQYSKLKRQLKHQYALLKRHCKSCRKPNDSCYTCQTKHFLSKLIEILYPT